MSRLWKMLTSILTVACLVGLGLVVYIQTQDDNNYEATAYFEKAIGLFPNSDVTILGVPVGKVTAVEPTGTRWSSTPSTRSRPA
jgi:phospholipid/cholesterol/gamma-HCH transport system substrate-binding protein